jgi:hypothetical protein
LAAFFSLGVEADGFFASLLLCLILPMIPLLMNPKMGTDSV